MQACCSSRLLNRTLTGMVNPAGLFVIMFRMGRKPKDKKDKKTSIIILAILAMFLLLGSAGMAAYQSLSDKTVHSSGLSESGSSQTEHHAKSSLDQAHSRAQASSAASSAVSAAQSGTLTTMLRTALKPVDEVLYVWGGGWNEEDTGGNEEANSIGMADSWIEFYKNNVNGYVATDHIYDIHNGLDCSGYIGWVLYNTLPEKRDYVTNSDTFGQTLASLGYGTFKPADQVTEILPGDIMSTQGHIYIAIGTFEDGSLLLLHSSPPGVRISGTYGIAYETALLYQQNRWDPLVDSSYLAYDQFRFNDQILPDPDGLRSMNGAQILDVMFEDPNALAQPAQ